MCVAAWRRAGAAVGDAGSERGDGGRQRQRLIGIGIAVSTP